MMNENIENNIVELDEETLEEVSGGKEYRIKVDEVNVRSGPGTNFGINGRLKKGKVVTYLNDKKKDKVSKWTDDAGKSTRAVNASTTLKDGVYTPDSFSWSGGSGRLAYIRCDKITVTNGKAYATIVFGSSSYDQLKANGRIY